MVAEVGGERGSSARVEFVWRWCRWTRWPLSGSIVAVAALTVGFDVVTAWLGFNLGTLGAVPISPTLPIGTFRVSRVRGVGERL